jgi:hypothetical protein
MRGRHQAADDAAPSPWRRRIALALLVGGRVLLVLGPLSAALCRVSKSVWENAPDDGGGVPDHWIPETTLAIALVFGFSFLTLVLPIGSVALAERTPTGLSIRAVLGTRRVDLTTARRHYVVLPGQGWNTEVVVLADGLWRWVALAASGIWEDAEDLPDRSRGARARQLAMGWATILVIAVVFFLVFGLLGAVAGIF